MIAINGAFAELGKVIQKNLPKILFATGVVASVAGVVSAAKATRKLDDVLVEHKEELERIEEQEVTEEYTEKDKEKEKFHVRACAARDVANLYLSTIALEALAIGCFGKAFGILHGRNVSLSAATLMAEKMYKEQDKAIRERFGDDVANEIKYQIKEKEIEKEVTDKQGRTKLVKKKEKVSEYDGASNFRRYFNECSEYYERDPEYNKSFLLQREQFANDELYRRYFYGKGGILTVNDVYDMLGFERTKAGACAGWRFDPTDPECMNKKHISFGIFDTKKLNADFVNGIEEVCILDFNIDTLDVFGEAV